MPRDRVSGGGWFLSESDEFEGPGSGHVGRRAGAAARGRRGGVRCPAGTPPFLG